MTKALRYPVFIPSKGRWLPTACLTARRLAADGVAFRLVVEEQEQDFYAAVWGVERLLILPFSNTGTVRDARNWIKAFSRAEGAARHWQLDDNIRSFYSVNRGKRVGCSAVLALGTVEEFVDRYENVGIAGLTHMNHAQTATEPFSLNQQCCWCVLVDNALPYEWRLPSSHDTDYSLQVLAGGSCTVVIRAFCVGKAASGSVKGGMNDLYAGDGRLQKFTGLSRLWPRLVSVKRRHGRPQPDVSRVWRKFTTPLKRKEAAP